MSKHNSPPALFSAASLLFVLWPNQKSSHSPGHLLHLTRRSAAPGSTFFHPHCGLAIVLELVFKYPASLSMLQVWKSFIPLQAHVAIWFLMWQCGEAFLHYIAASKFSLNAHENRNSLWFSRPFTLLFHACPVSSVLYCSQTRRYHMCSWLHVSPTLFVWTLT